MKKNNVKQVRKGKPAILIMVLIIELSLVLHVLGSCEILSGGPYLEYAEELETYRFDVKELPSSAETYLRNNSVLCPEEGSWDIPFDFSDADIIISGEIHSVASSSYKSKMELTRFFQQYYGVKYYLSECSVDLAWEMNQYLKTGDLEWLRDITMGEGLLHWFNTRNYHRFITELYEYNQTLDYADRIQFVGVDISYANETSVKQIVSYFPDTAPPAAISGIVNDFRDAENIEELTSDQYKQLFIDLQQVYSLNADDFSSYLSIDHEYFSFIINSIIRGHDYAMLSHDNNWVTKRDPIIAENVMELSRILPAEKIYGQWGNFHVPQRIIPEDNMDKNPSWANLISRPDSGFAGNLVSIYVVYTDCIGLEKVGSSTRYDVDDDPRITHFFEKIADSQEASFMLFSLLGPDTPFDDDSYVILNDTGGVTTDYFQYILLIQDSGPVSWW